MLNGLDFGEDVMVALAAQLDLGIVTFHRAGTILDAFPYEWIHFGDDDRFLGNPTATGQSTDAMCAETAPGSLTHFVPAGTYDWRMEAFDNEQCNLYYNMSPLLCGDDFYGPDSVRAFDSGVVGVLSATCTEVLIDPVIYPPVTGLPLGYQWTSLDIGAGVSTWLRVVAPAGDDIIVGWDDAGQGSATFDADVSVVVYAADRETVVANLQTNGWRTPFVLSGGTDDTPFYLRVDAATPGTFAIRAMLSWIAPNVVEISADPSGATTPRGEVASIVDRQHRTHVVWSDQSASGGEDDQLRYALVDASGAVTGPVTIDTRYRIYGPSVVVDANDNPHVAYFVRRNGTSTSSGNYAVLYATGSAGGVLTPEQVSTNAENPSDDTDDVFNADVSDRPQIGMSGAVPVVAYLGDNIAATGFANSCVVATRSGGWQREQAFVPTALLNGTDGFSLPARMSPARHVGWHDISVYHPRFASDVGGAWSETEIVFGDVFDTNHVQLEVADDDTVHFFWFDGDAGAIQATVLDDADFAAVETYLPKAVPSGNFLPATIDPVTGRRYMAVRDGSGSLVLGADLDGELLEVPVGQNGVIAGKRSLSVVDDYLSMTTFDEGVDATIRVLHGPITFVP